MANLSKSRLWGLLDVLLRVDMRVCARALVCACVCACVQMSTRIDLCKQWPDGSKTDPLDTAYKVLTEKGRMDVLVHPVMRGLQSWKFETFGRLIMLVELGVYVLWLLSFSGSLLLLPTPPPTPTNAPPPTTQCSLYLEYSSTDSRLVLELVTVALQTLLFGLHFSDARHARKQHGYQIVFPVPVAAVYSCLVTLGKDRWNVNTKRSFQVPTLRGMITLMPHAGVLACVFQRLLSSPASDPQACENHVSLLVVSNFLGWVQLTDYLKLSRQMGPFFIMVADMVSRDLVRFLVIPLVFLPAFSVVFVTLFRFPLLPAAAQREDAGDAGLQTPRETALAAHDNTGRSLYSLLLMGMGVGEISMFGGVQESDSRVMFFVVIFILILPVLALNLLIAMMADTYADVRSSALNRWSLKQAQYVQSRQWLANWWTNTHCPPMPEGYSVKGRYEEFFTGYEMGDGQDRLENLRLATFEEARRAVRLAEVAIDGIGGLNDQVHAQFAHVLKLQAESQKALAKSLTTQDALMQQLEEMAKTAKSAPLAKMQGT